MSAWSLLLLLSPLLLLIIIFGSVVIVAIIQAESKDVPAVLNSAVSVFCRLVDQAPTVGAGGFPPRSLDQDGEETSVNGALGGEAQ